MFDSFEVFPTEEDMGLIEISLWLDFSTQFAQEISIPYCVPKSPKYVEVYQEGWDPEYIYKVLDLDSLQLDALNKVLHDVEFNGQIILQFGPDLVNQEYSPTLIHHYLVKVDKPEDYY